MFSRGGWSVIRRSGPVSSGGFRSNTWSGPQDGPPIPIVLWISVTETSEWKTLTAVLCRVCFPSARIWFTSPAGDSGPGPISHGRSLMLEDDRSGSKRLHTDTDTILLLFGRTSRQRRYSGACSSCLPGSRWRRSWIRRPHRQSVALLTGSG